jgi:hypothetical protein
MMLVTLVSILFPGFSHVKRIFLQVAQCAILAQLVLGGAGGAQPGPRFAALLHGGLTTLLVLII